MQLIKWNWAIVALALLSACQGKLTDEQRKEMKEGMEAHEIKKISEADIIAAAFAYGRKIADEIDSTNSGTTQQLEQKYKVVIHPLQSGDSLLMEIEQQLIEAYTSTEGTVDLTDNVQKMGSDSLLYTKPIMHQRPDGSSEFRYALGIRMPKKEVILSMDN